MFLSALFAEVGSELCKTKIELYEKIVNCLKNVFHMCDSLVNKELQHILLNFSQIKDNQTIKFGHS